MPTVKRGRPIKYEWDKWFKRLERRGEMRFLRGTHYDLTDDSFAAQVRVAASNRGVNINVTLGTDGVVVRYVKYANGHRITGEGKG